MAKNPTEIMEIFASYDLTRCAWSAAQLVGCDPKTVQRYVDLRDAGLDPFRRPRRARLIDPHLDKVEELVEDSHGKIRADVVHDRLRAMGFEGNQRTTRRAVAAAKRGYRAGHRRSYRPWLPEPGKWLQFDWGDGPPVNGRRTYLFCAWLAWSRYRVVMPTWDRKLGTLLACLVIVGAGEQGLEEVWRHQLSVPGRPRILDEHYPDHPNGRAAMQPRLRPQREDERAFLAIGEGAERWLREAAASGAVRVRAKMAQATELALLFGSQQVDEALGRAAGAGRFGEDDLVSILSHGQRSQALHVVRADESFSAQPGTSAWTGFGGHAN